ncbi:MAG: AAA family ATPase, partial [Dehalococcoidales bacterium]
TPPISPTWHRADLPLAFESLIMMLLEKDPEKRPGSAQDVLAALESIEKGDIKEATVEQQVPTENPIYRRIFVGRENELKQLQNAFTGAMSGQGALMMVVGEPGIGKTAICEQLSTFVSLRGGMTLWGHCYEEGSLSLPYLAFVETMRSYVMDREPDDLKKELGSGATDVARIVSEVREKLHVEPRESQNPEEDRYRLMQAVTSFLSNAANVKPMLVILEDLHDADKGTLEMLSYVSRNLSGSRLLLIGTYRDVEVDRNHPLSAALAELRRISSFSRVLLRGLSIDEVRRMLENLTQENIPVGLAEAVHRQTEGNPLFVQEVVRYHTEEKLLSRESGKLSASGETTLEMNIPEGLRDVIGKRLSNLSENCNHLLQFASVIGREFSLDILKSVVDIDERAFVDALKEAIQLSILEERSQVGVIRYRFTHAFFRQTLYEELIAPERLKLHQQVARSMEKQYANRLEEHAAELAEHFSHSTDSVDLTKAVEYGELAAKRATAVYAYGEAVRLLDDAIRVQRVLDPDDKEKLCDLLLDLCDALHIGGEPRRILDSEGPLAFSLAESINDGQRAVRACMCIIYATTTTNMYGMLSPTFEEWLTKADFYAEPNSPERSRVDAWLAMLKMERGEWKEGERLLFNAFDLARSLNDPLSMQVARGGLIVFRCAPQHTSDRLKLAEENWTKLKGVGMAAWAPIAVAQVADSFLSVGQRDRFDEVFENINAVAQRTGEYILKRQAALLEVCMMILDGHHEKALEMIGEIQALAEQVGAVATAIQMSSTLEVRALINMGIYKTIEQDWARLYEGRMQDCMVYGYLGRKEDAIKTLDRFVVNRPYMGTDDDYIPYFADAAFLEASVLVGHVKAAEMLLDRLNGTGL